MMSRQARIAQIVIGRFIYRAGLVAMIAHLTMTVTGATLAAYYFMAVPLCAVTAALRREPFLGPQLSYWDEGMGFAALACVCHIAAFGIG